MVEGPYCSLQLRNDSHLRTTGHRLDIICILVPGALLACSGVQSGVARSAHRGEGPVGHDSAIPMMRSHGYYLHLPSELPKTQKAFGSQDRHPAEGLENEGCIRGMSSSRSPRGVQTRDCTVSKDGDPGIGCPMKRYRTWQNGQWAQRFLCGTCLATAFVDFGPAGRCRGPKFLSGRRGELLTCRIRLCN